MLKRFLKIVLLTFLITANSYAAPGDVWIQPEAKSININESFALEVRADTGTQKLGAYQFTVTFDPSIINVDTKKDTDGVETGADGFIAAVNMDNTSGKIVVNGFDVNGKGPGNALDIIKIYFYNLGKSGQTTIGIAANSLTDETGGTIGNPNGAGAVVSMQSPDLVVTSLSDPPGIKKRGGKFTVKYTTKNQGERQAGRYTMRYYLSLDTVKDDSDIPLKGKRTITKLKAGKISTGKAKVTIFRTTPSGNYYLIVCSDDTNKITESDEGNNCTASGAMIEVK